MRDWREGAHRVVIQRGLQFLADAIRTQIRHHQRIAIRSALRDESPRNSTARAGAVFHHHRLAIGLRAKAIGHQAGQRINRAAGAEGHNQAHLPIRPSRLRGNRRWQ